MSRLVEELRKDHVVIAENLNKVKSLGFTSEEGQNALLAAKNGLLAHLNENAAESDADLKRTLDTFAEDMNKISKAALEFFDKYSTGSSGIEFARDFGRLFATLSQRIRREESVLYQRYDEL